MSERSFSIVLVYLGKTPYYARDCVRQIRDWSACPIYFITDHIDSARDLLVDYPVEYIDASSLSSPALQELENKRQLFSVCEWIQDRKHLFYYSILRFYLLEAWMRKTNTENVFHLELDNLIYYDPNHFLESFTSRGLSYIYEAPQRGCAGIFIARDADSLAKMNTKLLSYISSTEFNTEMTFLGRYVDECADEVFVLPHTSPEGNNTKCSTLSSHFDDFINGNGSEGWVFDGMSYGIWLTGVDKIHSGGLFHCEKSKWIDLDLTRFEYKWEVDESGKKYPIVMTPHGTDFVRCRIFNLHVHSKDLKPYTSYKFNKPSNRQLITGEAFQHECDLFIDVASDDKDWVPKWSDDSRHRHIDTIPDEFDNPKVIFVRGWSLFVVPTLLQKCRNPFVLIAHNADEWIKNNQHMIPHLNHPKLLGYFSQNLILRQPRCHFLPIGLANSRWPHGNQEIFLKYMNRKDNTEKKGIFFNFSIETAPWYRQDCYDKCLAKGLTWLPNKPYEEYLQTLSQYKYAISPIGNGFDCHRIWECVYLGVIPIVMYHPFVDVLRQTVKMVILRDWNELNVNHLPIYLPMSEEIYAEDYICKFK